MFVKRANVFTGARSSFCHVHVHMYVRTEVIPGEFGHACQNEQWLSRLISTPYTHTLNYSLTSIRLLFSIITVVRTMLINVCRANGKRKSSLLFSLLCRGRTPVAGCSPVWAVSRQKRNFLSSFLLSLHYYDTNGVIKAATPDFLPV